MIAELHGLPYSGWTEKARWALDHHGIPYRFVEHLLIFGMPSLRLKLRQLTGEVTVPAFIDGDTRLIDSWEIARHADTRGHGSKLFPEGKLEAIREINDLSEEILDAGRALVLGRIAADPEAQADALPKQIPRAIRRALAPSATLGLAYIRREFESTRGADDEHERRMREALSKLRARLAGREWILGEFSYADVAAAAATQAFAPHPSVSLPAGIRRAWTRESIAAEFADILAFRDRAYASHRKRSN